eukprot:m.158963 g.158963  ORF g.158963 m.158963 type:complete len:509 (-) comp31114_c0_seq2:72-1598(-)
MATSVSVGQGLDPLFIAMSLLRRRKFEGCIDVCTKLLTKNPLDRAAWSLKARALTEQVYVDEIEMEEEGMAEMMLDDNKTAAAARPGTSFKRPLTTAGANPAIRPLSRTGRPVTGFARPGTQSARPKTMEQALKTARSSTAARPLTNATGRSIRLGTASMLTDDPTVFVDTSKLDLEKYAKKPPLAKVLFRYLLHVENDTLKALELAGAATKATNFNEWWWKTMIGGCYYRLGMLRDAERQFKSSLENQPMVFTTHLLGKVYIRLDQPINALECYQEGLKYNPTDTTLLAAIGRIHEGIGDLNQSVSFYKQVLEHDSTNAEAIASIAANYFYNDQPENALLLYRRLLQMGINSPPLFNNLGLSCFYAQQYDMSLSCFERALLNADDNTMADIWYNISHIAIGLGDMGLSYQCLKLAVTCDATHAEAYVNLGVLEHRKDNSPQARAHYQCAVTNGPHLYEAHFNLALLSHARGDIQATFVSASAANEGFPGHQSTLSLLKEIRTLIDNV